MFVIGGLGVIVSARKPYRRAKTATELDPDTKEDTRATTTTLHGLIEVNEPAKLTDAPSELEADWPALIAWRIREKVRSRGNDRRRSRWRTNEGGIAVGVPTLRHNWEGVALGLEEFENTDETSTSGYDPFDSNHLYLGKPDQQIYLGELDPVNKR